MKLALGARGLSEFLKAQGSPSLLVNFSCSSRLTMTSEDRTRGSLYAFTEQILIVCPQYVRYPVKLQESDNAQSQPCPGPQAAFSQPAEISVHSTPLNCPHPQPIKRGDWGIKVSMCSATLRNSFI